MARPLPSQRLLPRRPPAPATTAKAQPRVFICDDDLEFADELSSFLKVQGFAARTLKGALSPTVLLDEFAPDVVLLDIYMPPPDGFEMLGHIGAHPRVREISVVLMSGAHDRLLEMATRFCLAHHVRLVAALQKPLDLQAVYRACQLYETP